MLCESSSAALAPKAVHECRWRRKRSGAIKTCTEIAGEPKKRPFPLTNTDQCEEHDLPQGKNGTSVSSTPKACDSLFHHPRRRRVTYSVCGRTLGVLGHRSAAPAVSRVICPAGKTAFVQRQERYRAGVALGHFSRAKYGNFSRAPKPPFRQKPRF